MSKEHLIDWLKRWNLKPVDGAKILRIHKSKMSEYLSGKRDFPQYLTAHIETFNQLEAAAAQEIIKERLDNVPNGNYSFKEK